MIFFNFFYCRQSCAPTRRTARNVMATPQYGLAIGRANGPCDSVCRHSQSTEHAILSTAVCGSNAEASRALRSVVHFPAWSCDAATADTKHMQGLPRAPHTSTHTHAQAVHVLHALCSRLPPPGLNHHMRHAARDLAADRGNMQRTFAESSCRRGHAR